MEFTYGVWVSSPSGAGGHIIKDVFLFFILLYLVCLLPTYPSRFRFRGNVWSGRVSTKRRVYTYLYIYYLWPIKTLLHLGHYQIPASPSFIIAGHLFGVGVFKKKKVPFRHPALLYLFYLSVGLHLFELVRWETNNLETNPSKPASPRSRERHTRRALIGSVSSSGCIHN